MTVAIPIAGLEWRSLTATQQKILELLADQRGHSREELEALLPSAPLTDRNTLNVHMTYLRKITRSRGWDILIYPSGNGWLLARSISTDE